MDGLLNLVQQGGDWAARFVPTPPAIDTPLGGPPWKIDVWYRKTRMVWLTDTEKMLKMFIRFDRIHECDIQMDTTWWHITLHFLTWPK